MRTKQEILQGVKEQGFADQCYLDLKLWGERVFGLTIKDFHLEWMDLVNTNRFVALQAFRGSGKTTILGVVYPLWLCRYRPGTQILFTAAELSQAVKVLDEVKDTIENNEFLQDLMPPNPSTWKKTELKLTNGCRIYCKAYTKHIKGIHVNYAFCLHGETLVQTDKGPRRIQEICPGENVLTHLGRYKKVIDISRRHWRGKMYWVNTSAGMIKATGNHPFLVRDIGNRTKFRKAEKLTTQDTLLLASKGSPTTIRYKKNKVGCIKVNENIAKLFGLYLAEGCCSSGMVRFTFNNKETNLHNEVRYLIGKEFSIKTNYDRHLSHATTIYCCSKYLARKFCYWFNRYAKNKKVPVFMFRANTRLKALFAYYWLLGDGSFSKNRAHGSTASKELAEGMHELLNSISCYNKITAVKSDKSTFGGSGGYHVSLAAESLNLLRGLCIGKQARRHIECKISDISIKRCNRDVYNLLVEDDHTYCANGIITHNCDEIQDCIDRDIFNKAIAPCINKKKGHLVAVGAPDNPGDLLEELFHRTDYIGKKYPVIISPGVSRWPEAFSFDEIEKIRKRDGEASFQTQYMLNASAERENAVFPTTWIDSCISFEELFGDKKYDASTCVIGADFAIAQGPRADFDCYVVIEKVANKSIIRFAERHKGFPKDAKEQRLRELFNRFKPIRIIMDPSHIGEAILQDLRNEGLPVQEGEFHARSRHKLLVNLQMMMQPDKAGISQLVIPRNAEDSAALTFTNKLIEELIGFKEEKSQLTGMTSYVSKAQHDDTVMALALACKAASEQREFLDIVAI